MSGIDKRTINLADIQSEYLGFPHPYKETPSCRYDHRALVAYAQKVGKSINDLSYEEKLAFVIK